MPRLFGQDIAGQIAQALGGHLLPATLTKVIPGARTPSNLPGGTGATTADYTARGIIEDYTDAQIDGTLIAAGDRKVLLLGASIAGAAVPMPGDRVTIEGATYNVRRVERDPAGATYSLTVR